MKKIVAILFAVMLFIMKNGFSQDYTIYVYKPNSNITYNIALCNNSYILNWSVFDGSQVFNKKMSFGVTYQFHDTIILHDIVNNFSHKILKLKDSIVVLSGFELLQEKSFIYSGKTKTPSLSDSFVYSNSDYFLKKNNLIDSLVFYNNESFEISENTKEVSGCYWGIGSQYEIRRGGVITDTIYLNIKLGNKKYRYCINNQTLSEGSYTLKGEYILFKDSTFNSYFAAKLDGENNRSFTTITFPSQGSIRFIRQ